MLRVFMQAKTHQGLQIEEEEEEKEEKEEEYFK
jgi:hypothetical protein